jgi:hypothetical protein
MTEVVTLEPKRGRRLRMLKDGEISEQLLDRHMARRDRAVPPLHSERGGEYQARHQPANNRTRPDR